MRRRARRLFTLCSAVSLLLCVTVCVMWTRTYAGRDAGIVQFAGDPWRLGFAGGWLVMDNAPVATAAVRALRAHELQALHATDLHSQYYEELERQKDELKRELDEKNQLRITDLMLRHELPRRSADPARRPPPPIPPAPNLPPYRSQRLVPLALPAAATAILPAVWLALAARAYPRARRRSKGLCASCGYDLRASPDRCPECGTAADQA